MTDTPTDSNEATDGMLPARACSRSSKLWEVKHPYYCNEGNYYAKGNEQPHCHYKAWGEFMDGWGDSDMDYNFLIRWDWDEEGERAYTGDDYYRNGVLKVFWMGQRKGLYQWSTVEVCRADEPAVREFLQTRWDHMRTMWEPFSCENAAVQRPGEAGSVARAGSPAERESRPQQPERPQSPAKRGIDQTLPTEGAAKNS